MGEGGDEMERETERGNDEREEKRPECKKTRRRYGH